MNRNSLYLWRMEEREFQGTEFDAHCIVAGTFSEALDLFNAATGNDDDEHEAGQSLFHVRFWEYDQLQWLHRAIQENPNFLFESGYVNLAVLDPAPVPEGALGIWHLTAEGEDPWWVTAATEQVAIYMAYPWGPSGWSAKLVPVEAYHTLPWLRGMLLRKDPRLFTPTLLAGA